MRKFENYKKCIDYLFGLERAGIKYNLNNIRILLKFSGNPHKKFKSIHIAGTNGKGSVASIINSVLLESGLNTGLYTSPHINDFRERILVNGITIPKEFVINFTNRNFKLIEKIKPSFFEAGTALAFKYFEESKVDIAVIEAGLGGRLDSTNVLKPEVSVITGIDIDHTEYLGNTIEEIAFEKAGIIKKEVPCVCGKTGKNALKVIKKKCRESESRFIYSGDLWNVKTEKRNETNSLIKVSRRNSRNSSILLNYPIPGKYQEENIKTAFAALDAAGKKLGISFTEENIQSGIKNVIPNSKFFGRFQKISDSPKIIIDVSHNVQGIKNIKENLKYFKYKRLYIVFGMMKDKDYKKCINALEKLEAEIILTKPDYKRAEEPEVLYMSAKKKDKFRISEKPEFAVRHILKKCGKEDLVLLTGSFFLISDFLKLKPIRL